MCVLMVPGALEKLRKGPSKEKIRMWKAVTRAGRSSCCTPEGLKVGAGVPYGPGWHEGKTVDTWGKVVPIPRSFSYHTARRPAGIHAYLEEGHARDSVDMWGGVLVACYVERADLLAADKRQVAARRVYFRQRDWEKAGLPDRSEKRENKRC